MSWIWVAAVVGSLTGVTAMAYHRRYRGVPGPPPVLPWRANRYGIPPRMAHLGTVARYSGFSVLSVKTSPRQQPVQTARRCTSAADRGER
jgi:hypothetical protein